MHTKGPALDFTIDGQLYKGTLLQELDNGDEAVVVMTGYSKLHPFSMTTFTMGGLKYRSAIQAYEALKAIQHNDQKAWGRVMRAYRPRDVPLKVPNPDWNSQIQNMKDVLVSKFTLNPEAKAELMATGKRTLLYKPKEDDIFWGVQIIDGKISGANNLGKLLEETRNLFQC